MLRPTFCLGLFALSLSAQTGWQAGAARADITPKEPIWLAGYANREGPSEGVLQPIYLKALALRDGAGETSVLVTADLVGLDIEMVEEISRRARERYRIPRERLVLNYSHNHSCPVTNKVLELYYDLPPQQKDAVARYTRFVLDAYAEVIGKAVSALAPASLSFEQGLAGIAVNRRRARPGGRKLPGPVDQDVPVLAVREARSDKLKAVAFGYSCHTTTLSGQKVNGDYAGYAQEELEKANPGAVALFVMNCGGDANPLPRIMRETSPEAVDLARMYGKILAAAVKLVLQNPMKPVRGPLRAAYGTAEIPFQKGPPRQELERQRRDATGMRLREIDYLLATYAREGKLPDRYIYPVQVWRFGSGLTFVALTGETVVDYCLRFKKQFGWDDTWVAGYNNELLSYVPSLRVLREGDYEGTTGMAEYGHPAPYGYAIEESIAQKVDELYAELAQP